MSRQLALRFRKKRVRRERRGGARVGAGRPPKGERAGVSHLRRPVLRECFPVHVTVRVQRGLRSLRASKYYQAIYRAFCHGCSRDGFRIVQYSVQGNHIHLIAEASDERSLSRGMQGFCIRVAKAVNRAMDRVGSVFADRYHAVILRSGQQVRNALAYVLNNAKRHALLLGQSRWYKRSWVDPCSSAPFFDGWKPECVRWVPAQPERTPVAPAQTFLLATGWRLYGLLDTVEVPGPRTLF